MVYMGKEKSFPCCKLQLPDSFTLKPKLFHTGNPVKPAFPHKIGDMCITIRLIKKRMLILGFNVNKPLSFDENFMNKL